MSQNDVLATRIRCGDISFYYTFTAEAADERILNIRQHLAKLWIGGCPIASRDVRLNASVHYEYGQKSSFIMQLYVDFRTKYIYKSK